jgi:phospholipid-binding lipoprotein MlaA
MQGKTLLALILSFLTVLFSAVGSAQDEPDFTYGHPEDPWQGMNEAVFGFNDSIDRFFFKPVAKGYKYITPDLVQIGVSNVFSNLLEVRNVFNDVLQWKWGQATNDTGRLLLNSTVGLAGVFDVAGAMGLEHSEGEDFGQTLAVWGVSQGPYIVLPLLGPSTLRDGLALPVDWQAGPVGYIDHVPTRNTATGLGLLSTRADLLKAEAFVSGDRYTFLRDAYLQRRGYLIADGVVEDDFAGDEYDY